MTNKTEIPLKNVAKSAVIKVLETLTDKKVELNNSDDKNDYDDFYDINIQTDYINEKDYLTINLDNLSFFIFKYIVPSIIKFQPDKIYINDYQDKEYYIIDWHGVNLLMIKEINRQQGIRFSVFIKLSKSIKKQIIINKSGLQPVGKKILLEPELTRDTTPGGIVIPDSVKFDEKHSFVNGVILAIGGGAFKDWSPPYPQVGDLVRIHPHSGAWITGRDEEEYLIVEDKYVEALLV